MSVYIRSGNYKGLRGEITSKKPVHDKPYLYRVSLINHKSILIDKSCIGHAPKRRVHRTDDESYVSPTHKSDEEGTTFHVEPADPSCCCQVFCKKRRCDGSTCCCPSFVKCRRHDIYTFKNLLPVTTSKVKTLPIGAPELFRSTVQTLNRKTKKVTKMVVTAEEREYDFEDSFKPRDDFFDYDDDIEQEIEDVQEESAMLSRKDYTTLTLELVCPIEFEKDVPRSRRLKKSAGVRTVTGTIDIDEYFPVVLKDDKENRYDESDDARRNREAYEARVDQLNSRRIVSSCDCPGVGFIINHEPSCTCRDFN